MEVADAALPPSDHADLLTGSFDTAIDVGNRLQLLYRSVTAPQPVITVETKLLSDVIPSSFAATLFVDGANVVTRTYTNTNNSMGLAAGDNVRFAVQFDARTMTTGRHNWEMDIVTSGAGIPTQTRTYTGYELVVNTGDSPFGQGWWLLDYYRIIPQTGGVTLVLDDGSAFWWALGSTSGGVTTYNRPAGEPDFSTLTYAQSTAQYTLTSKHSHKRVFNAAGQRLTEIDRNGHQATYSYQTAYYPSAPSNPRDRLTGTVDFYGQEAEFSYNAATPNFPWGQVASIVDTAGRETKLGFTDGRLTAVTRPDLDLEGNSSIGLFDRDSETVYLRNAHNAGPADHQFVYWFPQQPAWPIAGDWDGDGIDSIGVYDLKFNLENSHSAVVVPDAIEYFSWGWTYPVAGDWDGDGKDTVGLYNPANSLFRLSNLAPQQWWDIIEFEFGEGGTGWLPIAGDWDGDGIDNVGVYNPANSTFYLRHAYNAWTDATFVFGAGGLGDRPVAGDWDNDGIDTVGLYRPSTREVFLRNAHLGGPADVTFVFGPDPFGDMLWPVAGDWDGEVLTHTFSYNTTVGHAAEGLMVSSTTPAPHSQTTSMGYDAYHRLDTLTRPHPNGAGGTVSTALDPIQSVGMAASNVKRTGPRTGVLFDELSYDSTFQVDRFGYLLKWVDALDGVTTYQRDSNGLVTELTQPDPDGPGGEPAPASTNTYDSKGNRTHAMLPCGCPRDWTYTTDNFNMVATYTEMGHVTEWTYDSYGNVATVEDALGNLTDFDVDSHGRVTKVTGQDPDGQGVGAPGPGDRVRLSAARQSHVRHAPSARRRRQHFDADLHI